jgi:hypothetical protein
LTFDRYEGIGHQQRHRLPQRARADFIAILEVFDSQALAGADMSLDDVLPQLEIGALAQGARF